MGIKLVLSDIDGTILDDKNQLDQNLHAQIKRLRQEKIPFVLCSARSPEGMYSIAKKLGLEEAPIASYNGAYIVQNLSTGQQVISDHRLSNEVVDSMLKMINRDFPTTSINLYSEEKWYVSRHDKWNSLESEITELKPEVTDLSQFIQTAPVHKLLLIDEAKRVHRLMEELEKARFPHVSFILSKDNYLEVTAKNATKKKALQSLANYFQLELDDTMAIGDNFNDVPMLVEAGTGVAMNNAPDQVKSVADVITKSNTENGVSKILAKYI